MNTATELPVLLTFWERLQLTLISIVSRNEKGQEAKKRLDRDIKLRAKIEMNINPKFRTVGGKDTTDTPTTTSNKTKKTKKDYLEETYAASTSANTAVSGKATNGSAKSIEELTEAQKNIAEFKASLKKDAEKLEAGLDDKEEGTPPPAPTTDVNEQRPEPVVESVTNGNVLNSSPRSPRVTVIHPTNGVLNRGPDFSSTETQHVPPVTAAANESNEQSSSEDEERLNETDSTIGGPSHSPNGGGRRNGGDRKPPWLRKFFSGKRLPWIFLSLVIAIAVYLILSGSYVSEKKDPMENVATQTRQPKKGTSSEQTGDDSVIIKLQEQLRKVDQLEERRIADSVAAEQQRRADSLKHAEELKQLAEANKKASNADNGGQSFWKKNKEPILFVGVPVLIALVLLFSLLISGKKDDSKKERKRMRWVVYAALLFVVVWLIGKNTIEVGMSSWERKELIDSLTAHYENNPKIDSFSYRDPVLEAELTLLRSEKQDLVAKTRQLQLLLDETLQSKDSVAKANHDLTAALENKEGYIPPLTHADSVKIARTLEPTQQSKPEVASEPEEKKPEKKKTVKKGTTKKTETKKIAKPVQRPERKNNILERNAFRTG